MSDRLSLLNGLRVVEAAAFIAAPSAGMHLAQMGAEVIRIDTIGGGPDFRRWPLSPAGDSLYWEGLNRGKKSVCIDLTAPEGRELAVALATAAGDCAGLFLTNFPANGFLSFDRLKAHREDIICVRIMGWGDGAPAVDYTINAAIGVPMLTGPAGSEEPVNHILPAWDLIAGMQAAFAMVAAESARRRTGEGADIRLALSDVAATNIAHIGLLAETMARGKNRARMGNDLFGAFGRDFVTGDGRRLMVVAITRRQWEGLVRALDLSDGVGALEREVGVGFGDDEGARFVHRARLYPLFERAFAAATAAELGGRFDATGVTWSMYQLLSEATADPRLFDGNPIFAREAHPSGFDQLVPGPATMIGAHAGPPLGAPPRLGEHSDTVLAEVLNLDSGAIARLHDKGLVAGASR